MMTSNAGVILTPLYRHFLANLAYPYLYTPSPNSLNFFAVFGPKNGVFQNTKTSVLTLTDMVFSPVAALPSPVTRPVASLSTFLTVGMPW